LAALPSPTRLALALCASLVLAACGDERAVEGESPAPPAAAPPAPAPLPAAPGPRLGLWVLAEGSQRALEHPERVDALLADAKLLGATDLFVQVYRGGRAWFDSSRADAEPFRRASETLGRDPLANLIERAHADDLRVHAWVNALSLAGNREAPILRALGPTAVHVDRRGRSLLDYPGLDVPPPERSLVRMGTPAVWLDPGAPGVAAEVVAVFAELAARYPALDGLHLDYIRFPDVLPFSPGSRFGVGLDFGYGAATRARFEAETGRRAPGPDGNGDADAWDDWRRAQVTGLVRAIRDAGRAANPDLQLSAAVSAYPERAYLSLFQDWRGWVDEGLLDFAVTMLYTRDDRLLRYEIGAYTGGVGGDRVWIGLGAWLFAGAPERALAQHAAARAASPAGIALFSWDSIAEAPALRDALARERAGGG
jgi:uncharacterized lipoprotein YddW (UPF0748 family)